MIELENVLTFTPPPVHSNHILDQIRTLILQELYWLVKLDCFIPYKVCRDSSPSYIWNHWLVEYTHLVWNSQECATDIPFLGCEMLEGQQPQLLSLSLLTSRKTIQMTTFHRFLMPWGIGYYVIYDTWSIGYLIVKWFLLMDR